MPTAIMFRRNVMSTELAKVIRSFKGYDYGLKTEFILLAKGRLRKLVKALGLGAEQYEIRANRGGDAVSGEVTLHADHIYVQISVPCCDLPAVMFRPCKGRKDYTGGRNHFCHVDDLLGPEIIDLIRQLNKGGTK